MIVWRISHLKDRSGYITNATGLVSFLEDFKEMEIGDPGFIVTKMEVPDVQYEQLTEFRGW